MTSHLYSNPHSQHGLVDAEIGAEKAVRQARQLTLDMCQASAEDYEVIFTSGATGDRVSQNFDTAVSTAPSRVFSMPDLSLADITNATTQRSPASVVPC